MTAFKKPFSRSLFEQNDNRARAAISEYFMTTFSKKLIPNTDKYGCDLMSEDGSSFVEVEIRNSWKKEFWPYSDFTICLRKLKYGAFDLYTLNDQCTYAVFVSAETIFKYRENIIHKSHRYSSGQKEAFISIPNHELQVIKI